MVRRADWSGRRIAHLKPPHGVSPARALCRASRRGIDPATGEWKETHPQFLVPGSALSNVCRAQVRDALKTQAPQLFAQAPLKTGQKTWGVHGKPLGDGNTALKYLTPDIPRVALSNKRLVSKNGTVTFNSKPRQKPWQTMTLDVMSCLPRFLQHVLPKGFQQVRDLGFLHPRAKKRFNTLNTLLEERSAEPAYKTEQKNARPQDNSSQRHPPEAPGICPHCGTKLRYIGRLPRCPAIETSEQQRAPS